MPDEKLLSSIAQYLQENYIPGPASAFDGMIRETGEYSSAHVFSNSSVPSFRPKASLPKARRKKVSEALPDLECLECEIAEDDALPAALGIKPGSGRKLDDLLQELDETFSEKLMRLIRERDLDDAEVYRKAFVDRRHFSKIRNDRNYKATKKTVLAFALALGLTLDEARDLLACSGYSLSKSSRYDVIMQYFFENGIYDIFVVNDVLYQYGEPVFE